MTDVVTAISFDMTKAAELLQLGPEAQVSLYDVSRFEAVYQKAAEVSIPNTGVESATENPFSSAFKALESLNGGGEGIGSEVLRMIGENAEMSPSEMIGLTMKAQHFLFQSQLMANIANKSSEGLQQLFRQQS